MAKIFLAQKLRGSMSLDNALDARLDNVRGIAERSSGFSFATKKSGGYSQSVLYPRTQKVAGAVRKDKAQTK